MKIIIITASLIVAILTVNIYKAGEKAIDNRNQKIKETYLLLGIK